ncbi:sodium-independent sulfate anion transporter-like isoform X3 [Sitodiplosis mosellana]|uniref:sodium-independent sulfate anion transporter-like isoform X3 n=1 Tax=Sitodiplosis mosellana TaxID=263140 RepID=UPI0024446FBF|nr:sodium-independent sulfate anion transporter-like isoform X3 [Sitodiplosis mosellana]
METEGSSKMETEDSSKMETEDTMGDETDSESVKLRIREPNNEKPPPKPIQLKIHKNWKELVCRRIYILSWIGNYDQITAVSDLIAGVTLGLTMIPQAIAYAALAQLPSHYGLYAAFIGAFIYVFFGTIKEVSIGPTSLMALLTLQYTVDKPPEFAIILAFLAGCVELAMGVLKLGFIVDFISVPVTSAFTSATSLIIIGAQLKNLLGIEYSSKGFADSVIMLIERLEDSVFWDAVLAVGCCIFLLALRQIKEIKVNDDTRRGQIIKKSLWYISISRNALIVLITSAIGYNWTASHMPPFKLSGKVEPGMPEISLPPFQVTYHNSTLSFTQVCAELGSGIIVVPLVAVLANVAIAKAFTTGLAVDASQEMITLGLCNIIGSCFKSMPTCGAFTRSAVSHTSGVKTPMAGLYSSIMTVLSLSLLTPYFYFIPKATLASVLVIAVMFMIDFKLPVQLWRKNRRDFIAWLACLIACLSTGVEIGLLCGVVLNILHLLFMWARPETVVKIDELDNMQYIRIVPNVGMFFPGIDHLRETVNKAASAAEYKVPAVVDCTKFNGLDYTSAQGIIGLADDLHRKKQVLILQNLDMNLHHFISSNHVLFCNREETLRELLTQEGIRNGSINLMQHIRASIDLGYKVDPLISTHVNNEKRLHD